MEREKAGPMPGTVIKGLVMNVTGAHEAWAQIPASSLSR